MFSFFFFNGILRNSTESYGICIYEEILYENKEKPYKVGVGFFKVGVHLDVMIVIVIISESLTPVMMSQNCG